jgi:hypothetical protein
MVSMEDALSMIMSQIVPLDEVVHKVMVMILQPQPRN